MLWLTLRQHRLQVLVTAGLLAAYGILLLINGISGAALLDGAPAGPEAGAAWDRFTRELDGLVELPSNAMVLVAYLPLLIGVFWGAPVLAKEFERGTQHLAWTQSVSRFRWLVTKLSVLGLLSATAGLAVGAMTSAWLDVYAGTRHGARFGDSIAFTTSGVAPMAWCVFGFGLGVAAGAVTRKMLPAMAIMLALSLGMMALLLGPGRDHYATAEREVVPTSPPTGGEVIDLRTVSFAYAGPDGQEYGINDRPVVAECPEDMPGVISFSTCLEDVGYRMVAYTHPADMYWRFQWTETGLLVVLTLGLAGLAVRQTTRRPA